MTAAALGAAGASATATADGRAARHPTTLLPPSASVAPAEACPIPPRFRPAFDRAALDTGFQVSMLVAVAEVESGFRPAARSGADARGLLQVLPSTAASLELDADRPGSNVLAGARYLRQLLDRYHSTDLALAAYNAGPTAVDRAGGVAPYPETAAYVASVQSRWRELAGCG